MIPAEAAEAAARVMVGERNWQAHSVTWCNDYLEDMRAALEAAAPYMLAAEYRRGYRDGLTDRKQVTAEPRAWEPGDPIE